MKRTNSLSKIIANLKNSGILGGIILFTCVLISLIIANSSLGKSFENLLNYRVGYESESIHLKYSILLWVNDGLMAIFFLLVGLEIKKELVSGELSSPKKAALPILAAIGGVVFPALIYTVFNRGLETAGGWGIPMATDIAFALAVISMLGKNVPISLKVFLAALAIVDDLMAILVIAIFYSSGLSFTYLLYAGVIFIMLIIMNKMGVRNLLFYLIPGVFIWYFIHHSGIHATIAGVLVAMSIPSNALNGKESPLEKLEHSISLPVNYMIMPLFALVNTNIEFVDGMVEGLFTPLGLGIIGGLMIGKPIGITLVSWIAVKLNIGTMPDKSNWKQVIGVGLLAGIGFTMSIFISILSFMGQDLIMAEAKFSILIASLLSGILGSILLISINKKKELT